MKIDEFLDPPSILLNFTAKNKDDALKQLVQSFILTHPKADPKALLQALVKREELGSTGIGSGVAIPHANAKLINKPVGFLAISRKGIEFKALDGELVYLLFLMVFPEGRVREHLLALSAVTKLLRNKFVRGSLLKADSPARVMEIFREEEIRESKPAIHKV